MSVVISFFSHRFDQRSIFLIGVAPSSMLGSLLLALSKNPYIQYSATFLISMGMACSWPLCLAQMSANLNSDSAKAAAISFAATLSNAGGLLSIWTLRSGDSEGPRVVCWLSFAACSTNLIAAISLHVWLSLSNRRRRQINVGEEIQAMPHVDFQHLDWKHPGFTWKL